jgi:ABC-type transport system substrate-binding protein
VLFRLARTLAFDVTTTDRALIKALQTLLVHKDANGASSRSTEYGVWLDLRVKTFDYWISTNLDFPTLDPDQYLYNTFHTRSSPATWDAWSDPEVDSLLDQGRATTDQATRQQIYTQTQQMLCQKVAAFWSYSAEHVDVATQKLLNFTPHPTTMLYGLVGSPTLPWGRGDGVGSFDAFLPSVLLG